LLACGPKADEFIAGLSGKPAIKDNVGQVTGQTEL
jgi:hypothetical protein